MGLTRYVLKRPVTTILALLCILVFGISSVFNATLEQMPDTDQPMLIVRASYSGATPEDMDELVTKPIEDQVSTLEGVKSMSSTSNEGNAMIMLEYDYDQDMDDAYNELTRSLNSIRGLPDDCNTSVMDQSGLCQCAVDDSLSTLNVALLVCILNTENEISAFMLCDQVCVKSCS